MAYHEGDPEDYQFPEAVRRDQLPNEEDFHEDGEEDLPDEDDDEGFPDEDRWYKAVDKLYEEKGEEGFLALLRELAPHLESPLLILEVWNDVFFGHAHGAEVWHVQPGASEVETLGVERP
jgi:hypothetical protein